MLSKIWMAYLPTYSLHGAESFLRSCLVFAANQEIPRILWKSKVHYLTHKRPPPVPILNELHPVPSRSILILSSHLRLGLPYSLFPSGFLTKPCAHLHLPPYVHIRLILIIYSLYRKIFKIKLCAWLFDIWSIRSFNSLTQVIGIIELQRTHHYYSPKID